MAETRPVTRSLAQDPPATGRPTPRRRLRLGWHWPAALFGGWWAIVRGSVPAGAAAVAVPFWLMAVGEMPGAILALLAGHLGLALFGRPGPEDREGVPLLTALFPILVVGTAAGLAFALQLGLDLTAGSR